MESSQRPEEKPDKPTADQDNDQTDENFPPSGPEADNAEEETPIVPPKELERMEVEEAYEKSTANARVVYKAILLEGQGELKRPSAALAWSGLAAGLSMGFSLVAEGLLRCRLPDTPWRPLVAKLGYTIGFLIVILGRQQLFTENTLTVILPLLRHRNARNAWNVARLWTIVLLSNLLGTAVMAWVMARTSAFDEPVKAAFADIARESLHHPFGTMLLRGIFSGWLIALMVWLLPVAEIARVWVIIIITYIVGLGPSTHIVAGSVDSIYAVAAGLHGWGDYFSGFVLPSLLGNVIGGVSLVAALNYAQVVAGGANEP